MEKISTAKLAALFAPLAGRRALLAVSGGPDSLALLRFAALWLAEGQAAGASLHVATVDHGLRPGSREEAEAVGGWSEALGLPHSILTWQGAKPKSRIQERARAARYALLGAHARELGADYLLTAHHADDQAETILFRLLRGSGLAGLAGMSSEIRLGGITLYRPLLIYSKKTLIDYCEACDQPYFRDPSNENSAFARTRLRALLPLLEEAGLSASGLARLGRRAARAEQALAVQTETVRAMLRRFPASGGVGISVAHLGDCPEEILRRIIAAEISTLGVGKPLRLDRLERLAQDLCAALHRGRVFHGTLGGVRLSLAADGLLTLRPEKTRRRGLVHDSAVPKPCEGPGEAAML
ncbi:tRNA lysidine(34) synthetase TilS [Methylovirgula ligni]|uniref:tRNA(Ile)-lysidine synthase n=1 Tax=Methylovirgula ligni TaxID=569860 RepID=A0A3D9YYT2_9HYPH|nr:tRNA lysidine(34) synthetase TilS [Methylovirgula ligni]QAY94351.1 tRNA lysidine(34) synthetase TilS [Methylovirgula ligni]REF87807.1 tRNA(Ile)-lysidine synthase [Methylovirgula ligni]